MEFMIWQIIWKLWSPLEGGNLLFLECLEHPAVYQFTQVQPWLSLNAVIDNGMVIAIRKPLSTNNKHCLLVENPLKMYYSMSA